MGQVNFKTHAELEQERLVSWREGAKVSKFQARAALLHAGLFGQVKAKMDALPEDNLTRMAWEDAQEFQRNSETVLEIATELELTDVELDGLFQFAKTINA